MLHAGRLDDNSARPPGIIRPDLPVIWLFISKPGSEIVAICPHPALPPACSLTDHLYGCLARFCVCFGLPAWCLFFFDVVVLRFVLRCCLLCFVLCAILIVIGVFVVLLGYLLDIYSI